MSVHVSAPAPGTHIVTGEHGVISQHMTAHIALVDTAPGQARRLLHIALTQWGLGHLADSADLITSELVTNAFIHGTEPALLNLYTDRVGDGGLFFIEVEDAGKNAADDDEAEDAEDADELPEGGRGLLLVDALAEDWGFEEIGSGTRVWASLAIAEKPREEEQPWTSS